MKLVIGMSRNEAHTKKPEWMNEPMIRHMAFDVFHGVRGKKDIYRFVERSLRPKIQENGIGYPMMYTFVPGSGRLSYGHAGLYTRRDMRSPSLNRSYPNSGCEPVYDLDEAIAIAEDHMNKYRLKRTQPKRVRIVVVGKKP